eukprot:CAMPEP_0197023852 /NCGR_PEP_ID=MMETSP1384-20130603/4488_1 /TAXON_ID=29189 /ORGANISM="Ammonia sp." /LENGTH=655 /DNA_ID=CAMNT_0042452133 /DNA_START=127 /DNA_END=2097 /DNA_ORIENTATION=-
MSGKTDEENAANKDDDYDQPWKGLDIDKIVSIDFGSFGFAAAFCPVGVPSHLRPVQDWSDHRASAELNKNLAALLIDKETKETVAMGFEAEELYTKAQEKKEDDKYMYFAHFKPFLYSKDHLEKNVPVPAADGVSTLPLSELITKSLHAVMQHTLAYINGLNKLAGIAEISVKQIFWVLCVPAIWDEMSKEMMKFCARKAGMEHFELGSEPIVSTFYVMNAQGKEFRLRKNDKIMILDCGGGTIDAACIEIQSSSYDLSELHHGDGIRAGGLDVDRKFGELLAELLPTDIVSKVQTKQPAQWMRQRNEFVLAKFSVPFELDDWWNVPFCFGLNSILSRFRKKRKDPTYKNIKENIEKYEIADYLHAEHKNDDDEDDNKNNQQNQPQPEPTSKVSGAFSLGRANLKVKKQGWLYLHEDVFSKIMAFVHELFSHANVQGCEKVIVVGGFANSEYLKARLLKEFPDKTFLCPKQPHLAVVKGALYWICQRRKLKKTRANYSYGIAIDRRFKNDVDPEERKKILPGIGAVIENAFGTLVERNAEYEDGYTQTFDYWIPAGADHLEVFLYASEDSFCQFVFKENPEKKGVFDTLEKQKAGQRCFEVKRFIIPITNVSKERKQFQLTLEYRQNGINLSYKDPNTGDAQKVKIDTSTAVKKK